MAGEFQETIRLTATDDTKAATDSANRNLQGVEDRATRMTRTVTTATDDAVRKIVTITQTSQNAIERTVRAAQQRATVTAMPQDNIERAKARQQFEMQRVAGNEVAMQRLAQAHRLELDNLTREEAKKKQIAAEEEARAVRRKAEMAEINRAQQLRIEKETLINKLEAAGAKDVQATAAAYDKLIRKEEETIVLQKEQQNLAKQRGIFATARAVATGDVGAAGGVLTEAGGGLGSIVTSLGAMATGATIAVGAIAGVTAAAYAAAKAMGEWAIGIKDVELRTGLTAREVSQFSFAARAEGQDISIIERAMRGLTEATADMSPAGAKARQTLRDLKIETHDLMTGGLRPTGELLLDISEALAKLPAGAQRDKAALDLFKRAGIELVPVMEALQENVKYFEEHGMPSAKQEDIDKLVAENREVVAAELAWERLKRAVEKPLVATFEVLVKIPDWLKDRLGFGGVKGPTLAESVAKDIAEEQKQRAIEAEGGMAQMQKNAQRLSQGLYGGLEGAEARLSKLKQAYDTARTGAEELAKSGAITAQVLKEQSAAVAAARAAYESQDAIVKKIRKDASDAQALENRAKEAAKAASEALIGADLRLKDAQDAMTGANETASASIERSLEPLRKRLTETMLLDLRTHNLAESIATLNQAIANTRLAAAQEQMNKFFGEAPGEAAQQQDKMAEAAAKAAEERLQYQDETFKLQDERIKASAELEVKETERARKLELDALEQFDAVTLQQKLALEQKKLEIELRYAQIAKNAKLAEIDAAETADENAARRAADERQQKTGQIEDPAVLIQRQMEIHAKYEQQRKALDIQTTDEMEDYRLEAMRRTNKEIEQADQQLFEKIKGEVSGLLDSLMSGNKKSIIKGFEDLAKSAFLKPFEDLVSTRIAGSLTQGLTGHTATYQQGYAGNTALGQILSKLGFMGTTAQFHAPLGGATVYPGTQALMVVVMNPNSPGTPLGLGGAPTLSSGPGILSVGGGTASQRPLMDYVRSSITFEGQGGGATPNAVQGAPISSDASSAEMGGAGQQWGPLPFPFPSLPSYSGGAGAGNLGGYGGAGPYTGPMGVTTPPFMPGPAGPGYPGGGGFNLGNIFRLPGGQSGGNIWQQLGGVFNRSAAGKAQQPGIIYGAGGDGGLSANVPPDEGMPSADTGWGENLPLPIGTAGGMPQGGTGGTISQSMTPFQGMLSGLITTMGMGILGAGLQGRAGRTTGGAIPSGIGGAMMGSQLGPQLLGMSGMAGGLAGLGIGVGIHGLTQGGVSGLLQSTGGFALAGFEFGGPIGAAIGAGIGLVAGGIRMLIKTKIQKLHDKIKAAYGVDVKDQGILQQLATMSQTFGGNLDATIYSQQGRQLIMAYAMASGQHWQGIAGLPVMSQYSNTGGQLTAVPSYFNGSPTYPGQLQQTSGTSYLNPGIYNATSSYLQSGIPTGANVVPGVGSPTPAAINLSLDGASTQALLQGGAVSAIQANPRLVSVATISGQDASAGRRDAAVNVLQPNFIVS